MTFSASTAAGRLLDQATDVSMALGCLATLLMMLHVAGDVTLRLLLRQPIPGTLETVTYVYMVAVVFLPLAMVQRRRQQIVVELFTHAVPPRLLAVLDGCVGLLGAVFMAAVTWFSGKEAWAQTLIRETAPSMMNPVPIWPARWFVVVGAGLVGLYLLMHAIDDLRLAAAGDRLALDARLRERQALPEF